jgi:hypothetical protein
MKRQLLRLSQKAVVNKKAPGYYPDGGGLYLQVSESGSKSWLFRFAMNGKEQWMGLGPFHTIGLPLGSAPGPLAADDSRTHAIEPIPAHPGFPFAHAGRAAGWRHQGRALAEEKQAHPLQPRQHHDSRLQRPGSRLSPLLRNCEGHVKGVMSPAVASR